MYNADLNLAVARRFNINWDVHEPTARWGKMFLLSCIVGILSGLAAAGMHYLLEVGTHRLIGQFSHLGNIFVDKSTGELSMLAFSWRVMLMPAVGGLLSGLIIYAFARDSREHGTNEFINAFHHQGGSLQLKGPMARALASVGVISFGGSTGPEGPMSALGAAIGSTIARVLKLSPQYRRVLLIAGCGGGIGAIFQCPLGGALFAASVLYQDPDFEADSMVPAFVASVVSYATFMFFPGFGHHLLEGASELAFLKPIELLPYLVLGLLCGGVSILFYICLQGIESRPLRRWNIPKWLAPAFGGLLVGLLGCALPQVMDGQYDFIQNAMNLFLNEQGTLDQQRWAQLAMLFGLVAILKCVATALTVGSGGAGGVLGPSVFIGGATGACLAAIIAAAYSTYFPAGLTASLVPVGMAGVLAATMRTPLAAIVMVTEMTGSYGLIVPLMLVCVTSYVIGRRWGLNDAQVRSSSESPAHVGDALVHMLEALRVKDLMERQWPYTATPATTLGEMVASMRSGTRPIFAVLDRGELVGVISITDIRRVIDDPYISDLVIADDLMTTKLTVVLPDQGLYEVLETFNEEHHEALPVVDPGDRRRFLGMLPRQAIHHAVRERSEEMRTHLHREHAGIATIEQDEQLYQLVMGVSAPSPDTIQRIVVPHDAIGKSLRETDFRRRYGAQVIGVQRSDGTLQCPPDIDAALTHNVMLLVIMTSPIEARTRAEESHDTNTAPE